MNKGLKRIKSLINKPTEKQLNLFILAVIFLFIVIQFFTIPWQTSYKINRDGQSIPIHLWNSPIWAPPKEMKIGGRVFSTKPIIDSEKMDNRICDFGLGLVAFIYLKNKLRKRKYGSSCLS